MSPTLNKGRLDAKVHLQKWLSGHFFLIVKLSVMEFSKRATKRKHRRQKIAINLDAGYCMVHCKICHTVGPMKC